MSSILALKVISAQEILEDSELKSTILSMLRLHVITDTIPAGRECKALNKGHNWGMKELTLYWQADWSRIESISKSNKSYSTQVVVDVDPDRSASRGAQADQPISLEADPSFAEREAAGATVTPSRHSHISELMHWYPKQLRGGDDKSSQRATLQPLAWRSPALTGKVARLSAEKTKIIAIPRYMRGNAITKTLCTTT